MMDLSQLRLYFGMPEPDTMEPVVVFCNLQPWHFLGFGPG